MEKQRSGIVKWESPSNIALVKYWGKYGRQYPQNPSISFTLSNAKSITSCEYEVLNKPTGDPLHEFYFEGQRNEKFEIRIRKYLQSILPDVEVLKNLKLKITSENTFPHSSGIASSASAMSALALCICDISSQLSGGSISKHGFKASSLARLGSGSASRSTVPKIGVWGELKEVPNSSNDYAVPYHEQIDPLFLSYHDDILIVSKSEKSVSSSAGHALMDGNPYAKTRYQSAQENLIALLNAMEHGDLNKFIEIVEREAMTLHALMMCSSPSYILMEPATLTIINKIRAYRNETGLPVCFTLDAGPNIHLLYPDSIKLEVNNFINSELLQHTQDATVIRDVVGNGPSKLV